MTGRAGGYDPGMTPIALTVANDTLVGILCVVLIVAGLLFIFGRGWRR